MAKYIPISSVLMRFWRWMNDEMAAFVRPDPDIHIYGMLRNETAPIVFNHFTQSIFTFTVFIREQNGKLTLFVQWSSCKMLCRKVPC